MKRILTGGFLVALLIILPVSVFGAQSFSIPCSSGSINGTLDISATGSFTINYEFDSCALESDGLILDGSGTTTGTFVPVSQTQASLNATMNVTLTLYSSDGTIDASGSCSRSMNGTLDMSTTPYEFDGSFSFSCNGNGKIPFDVITFLLLPPF